MFSKIIQLIKTHIEAQSIANQKAKNELMNQRIYHYMLFLRQDLFAAIGGKHYNQRLDVIRDVSEIRIHDYRYDKNQLIFMFSINKSSNDETIRFKQDTAALMNQDIRALVCTDFDNPHPFLNAGTKVLGIRDNGFQAILELESLLPISEVC